ISRRCSTAGQCFKTADDRAWCSSSVGCSVQAREQRCAAIKTSNSTAQRPKRRRGRWTGRPAQPISAKWSWRHNEVVDWHGSQPTSFSKSGWLSARTENHSSFGPENRHVGTRTHGATLSNSARSCRQAHAQWPVALVVRANELKVIKECELPRSGKYIIAHDGEWRCPSSVGSYSGLLLALSGVRSSTSRAKACYSTWRSALSAQSSVASYSAFLAQPE